MVGAAVVVVLAGLKAAQTLVIPFLLALFLAIICFPAVAWLNARKVPVGLRLAAGDVQLDATDGRERREGSRRERRGAHGVIPTSGRPRV